MKVNERGEQKMIERGAMERQGTKEKGHRMTNKIGQKALQNEKGGELKRCHERKEIKVESG